MTRAKRQLDDVSAPISFMYRLLSSPALSKRLAERMAHLRRTPQRPFPGSIEERELTRYGDSVIQAHLANRDKMRQYAAGCVSRVVLFLFVGGPKP